MNRNGVKIMDDTSYIFLPSCVLTAPHFNLRADTWRGSLACSCPRLFCKAYKENQPPESCWSRPGRGTKERGSWWGNTHLAETFTEGLRGPRPLEMEPGSKVLMADSLETRGSSWLLFVYGARFKGT